MKPLSRASVINDIEFIVNRHNPVVGGRRWTADGVLCVLDRHNYLGGPYSFHTDVLTLETQPATKPKWKVMIVSQFWEGSDGETMHSSQFLKLLAGRKTDVSAWISANREQELKTAIGAANLD